MLRDTTVLRVYGAKTELNDKRANGVCAIRPLLFWVAVVVFPCQFVVAGSGEVPPSERHAGMPDSWLVIYNTNDFFSEIWANSYQVARGVPAENLFGVAASLNEHLATEAEAQAQIIGPVREFLETHPEIESRIMGILVGYGVPGTFATPPAGGPGGFSIADALEDMWDDADTPLYQQKGFNSVDNPQFLNPSQTLPPGGRLTKATMEPGRYMVARIDAPTFVDAISITDRSIAFENAHMGISDQYVYYDYRDFTIQPGGEWVWMRRAVEEPDLNGIPWREFDADTEATPLSAFRFGTHDLSNWNNGRLSDGEPGARILAFNFNSLGASTVRSTTAQGGRYVPNAIAAGYLAAIGSTGEPQCCHAPIPETLLAGLREGWTLGESFHIASVFDDWMWTLIGDPLLTVPYWFHDNPVVPGDGDANDDGVVNGLDLGILSSVLSGSSVPVGARAALDLSGDGVVDDDDAFLMLGPTLHESLDPDELRGGGDLNGDSIINSRDLEIFIAMLTEGEVLFPVRARLSADVNRDGAVTVDDIELFVQSVLHGRIHTDKRRRLPARPAASMRR